MAHGPSGFRTSPPGLQSLLRCWEPKLRVLAHRLSIKGAPDELPTMKFLLIVLALLGAVLCAPDTPDADAFYSPPAGWEQKAPGAILKTRTIEPGIVQYLKWNLTGYQLLYRTTAMDDAPSHTVTTVLVPSKAQKDKLLLIAPYIDADGPQCAPSYTVQYGAHLDTNLLVTIQDFVWTAMANQGWILTVPDQLGPMNAFGAGRLEGRMLLDGARATLQFQELGLQKNTSVVGYGYSGGGLSGGWAASLHAKYAPELNVAGWVLGGMPANMSALMHHLDGGIWSGFVIGGLAGLMNGYAALRRALTPRLTKEGRSAIHYANTHCSLAISARYPLQKVQSDKYARNGTHLLSFSPLDAVVASLTMGMQPDETPRAPVFYFHARHDDIIPYSAAAQAAKRWSSHGAHVKMLTFSGLFLSHTGMGALHVPYVLREIRERFRRVPVPPGLTTETLANPLLDPHVPLEGIKEIWGALTSLFASQIGARDKLVSDGWLAANSTRRALLAPHLKLSRNGRTGKAHGGVDAARQA